MSNELSETEKKQFEISWSRTEYYNGPPSLAVYSLSLWQFLGREEGEMAIVRNSL